MKILKSVHGPEIPVEHVKTKSKDGLLVIKITARGRRASTSMTWTVGAVNGKRPAPPTTEELQKKLDAFRQQMADEAAWKDLVHMAADGLD